MESMNELICCGLMIFAAGIGIVTVFWFIMRISAAFEAAAKYRRKYEECLIELQKTKILLGDEQIANDHMKQFRQHARLEYDTEIDAYAKRIAELNGVIKHQQRMIDQLEKQVIRNKNRKEQKYDNI